MSGGLTYARNNNDPIFKIKSISITNRVQVNLAKNFYFSINMNR